MCTMPDNSTDKLTNGESRRTEAAAQSTNFYADSIRNDGSLLVFRSLLGLKVVGRRLQIDLLVEPIPQSIYEKIARCQ